MKCPRTNKDLKEIEIDGVKVDVSEGCGGIFFDNFELEKFDEIHETAGDRLLETIEPYSNVVDVEKRIQCPKCNDVTMFRHYFSIKRKIAIDDCPQCGGIWLDLGELLQIRTLYPNEEERKRAAKAYIDDLFDKDAGVIAMRLESEEKLRKARRFANMFKFICPSYYIPGKQDWAAF